MEKETRMNGNCSRRYNQQLSYVIYSAKKKKKGCHSWNRIIRSYLQVLLSDTTEGKLRTISFAAFGSPSSVLTAIFPRCPLPVI
jgi:hypothetical protein